MRAPLLLAVLSLLGFAGIPALPAQDTAPGLTDVLEQAAAENPGLHAARLQYEAALQRIPQAGRLPDPRLTVTWFAESIQTRTGPQEATYNLMQPVPWPGKLGRERNLARQQAEALYYLYLEKQLELLEAVAIAYYDYAGLGKEIELAEESLELLRKLEPVVEEKVRGGGRLNTLLLLQVRVGAEENKLLQLQEMREMRSAQIRALQGQTGADLLPWPALAVPPAAEFSAETALAQAREVNPRLLKLRAMIDSREARLAVARLMGYPEFGVGLTYIQTGEAMMETPGSGTDPWALMFTVTIPWDRTKYNAAEAEAGADAAAAQAEYESALQNIEAQITTALAQWKSARNQLGLFDEGLLPDSRQALEVTQSTYQTADSSLTELIEAQREVIELQQTYWSTVAAAWKARVRLQALSGAQPFQVVAPSQSSTAK